MYMIKLARIYGFSNYMVTDYNKEKQINCTIMRIVHLSFHCVELAARRGWFVVDTWQQKKDNHWRLRVGFSYDVVVVDSFGNVI